MTLFGPTGVDEALDDSKHVVELPVDQDVVDRYFGVDAASQPIGDVRKTSCEAADSLHPADVPGPGEKQGQQMRVGNQRGECH